MATQSQLCSMIRKSLSKEYTIKNCRIFLISFWKGQDGVLQYLFCTQDRLNIHQFWSSFTNATPRQMRYVPATTTWRALLSSRRLLHHQALTTALLSPIEGFVWGLGVSNAENCGDNGGILMQSYFGSSMRSQICSLCTCSIREI